MPLDAKKEHATELIAAGELRYEDIAERVGVVISTLWLWRKDPEFMARVDEKIEQINASLRRLSITHPERRVAALDKRHKRLTRILDERHDDDVTGADAPLLKELRELEKQAAQELGQWTAKTDVTTNGESLAITVVEVVRPVNADTDTDADADPDD